MSGEVIHAFGQVLREARQHKGWSQQTLAYESEVDRAFISLLESGRKQPSLTTIWALATALGTPVSVLLQQVEGKLDTPSLA